MYYSNEYLAHHGVKGMKWGRRRYQNPDGSLTPAGKKRQAAKDLRKERIAYDTKRSDARYNQVKRVGKTLVKKGPKAAYKKTRTSEYKQAKIDNKRLNKEKKYLTPKDRDRLYQDVNNGKNYATSFRKRKVSSTLKVQAVNAAYYGIKYRHTIAKTVVAVGAAYVASRAKNNNMMALPASDILNATVHSVRTV